MIMELIVVLVMVMSRVDGGDNDDSWLVSEKKIIFYFEYYIRVKLAFLNFLIASNRIR